ncbi:MAG: hypothetical protein LBT14_08425 [Treponema sp.]|jgi:hypothetical protein|nr:hypothetical protein [Treponema sp.]
MTADMLNQTFSIYKALKHSLRVTKRIVESSDQCIRALHKETLFWDKRTAEFKPEMVSIVTEFNDMSTGGKYFSGTGVRFIVTVYNTSIRCYVTNTSSITDYLKFFR